MKMALLETELDYAFSRKQELESYFQLHIVMTAIAEKQQMEGEYQQFLGMRVSEMEVLLAQLHSEDANNAPSSSVSVSMSL